MWDEIKSRRRAWLGMQRRALSQPYDYDPPPISEAEVASIERHLGIELPTAYRTFLLEVANGGAGPCSYPLMSLAEAASHVRSDLHAPFPHHGTWIRQYGDSSEDELAAHRHSLALAGLIEEHEPLDPYLYAVDWDVQDNGRLTIGTSGCGLDFNLVLTGPHRGEIWHERDAGTGPIAARAIRSSWPAVRAC